MNPFLGERHLVEPLTRRWRGLGLFGLVQIYLSEQRGEKLAMVSCKLEMGLF